MDLSIMLSSSNPPRKYRNLITDNGATLWFEKGRVHVVDGIEYPHAKGRIVAHARRVLAIGNVRLRAEGPMRISAAQDATIITRHSSVTAQDRVRVKALVGSDSEVRNQCSFEARDNAYVHVYDEASGVAFDEAVIFFHPGAVGEVKIRSLRVRVVDFRIRTAGM